MIDRQRQHGPFPENAQVSQALKRVVRDFYDDCESDIVREALDNICQKMARIITGQSFYQDHWNDIQGYAERIIEYTKSHDFIFDDSEESHIPKRDEEYFIPSNSKPKTDILNGSISEVDREMYR